MSTLLKHNEPALIWTGKVMLDGVLTVPHHAEGLIVITGLGSTFRHERIRSIAAEFESDRFATLTADVLTPDEQQFDERTKHFRVDTPFLASRIVAIAKWARTEASTRDLPVALFAGSATSAACIAASADLSLFSLVLAGPRFDTPGDHLRTLDTPTLIIFDDLPTLVQLRALRDAGFGGSVLTIADASSLLENDAAAGMIAREAAAWFRRHVPTPVAS
ncbi:MAG: hypothetical protein ACXVIJ_00930 [Thermoanaerobaculia bacterium]